MHRASLPLLLAAAACTPQNAELTQGSYIAFLAEENSLTLEKQRVDPEDYAKQWDVDCREFATQEDKEALELPDALDICGQNKWPPVHEQWGTQAGYHVVTEALEPWRGEALITSEGDLQIAFHQRVPGGQDFRFVFSVDPDFAPVTCETDAPGEPFQHVLKDGHDWVDEWSTELAAIEAQADDLGTAFDVFEGLWDGRLYFLNAYGYQLNPANTLEYWSLPNYWNSGAAQGKFVEEGFYHRTPRYGEPYVYNLIDQSSTAQPSADEIWWCDMEDGSDPTENPCLTNQDEYVRGVASTIRDELNLMMTPEGAEAPEYDYMPLVHSNFWRGPDGRPPGFDGWSELHYNYVVFDKSSVLEAGGQAEGAFALVFDAGESSSRFFVKGRFVIDRIKKDKWTTPDLQHEKLVENNVQLCDAASWYDANLPGPVSE